MLWPFRSAKSPTGVEETDEDKCKREEDAALAIVALMRAKRRADAEARILANMTKVAQTDLDCAAAEAAHDADRVRRRDETETIIRQAVEQASTMFESKNGTNGTAAQELALQALRDDAEANGTA